MPCCLQERAINQNATQLYSQARVILKMELSMMLRRATSEDM